MERLFVNQKQEKESIASSFCSSSISATNAAQMSTSTGVYSTTTKNHFLVGHLILHYEFASKPNIPKEIAQ